MNDIVKFDPTKLADQVRDRIRNTFADLIPEDAWKTMVEAEIHAYTRPERNTYSGQEMPSPFARAVREELEKALRERVKAMLNSPEWAVGTGQRDENACFIAAARSDVPRLLDALEEAERDTIAGRIVEVMSELLGADPAAIGALIGHRVPCNQRLADHPTAQVAAENGSYSIGLIGVLNAIGGCNASGVGFVAAEVEDDGSVMRFVRLGAPRGTP